jgi:hypothetical protein
MDALKFRQVANWVNLSTPLGLAIAKAGRADIRPGERRLVVATGYRLGFPIAPAFTVGSVIITRHDREWITSRPELLAHEERHTWQYVACLGVPFLPLYAAAMGWSKLRTGNRASGNIFERRAGLEAGGYLPRRDSSDPGSGRLA